MQIYLIYFISYICVFSLDYKGKVLYNNSIYADLCPLVANIDFYELTSPLHILTANYPKGMIIYGSNKG